MIRDALPGARVLLAVLGFSLGSALLLVLLGAPGHASGGDVLRGAVLVMGAAFGGQGSMRVGGATVEVTAAPLLISVLSGAAAWGVVRHQPLRGAWVAAVAMLAGLIVAGTVLSVNGWRGLSVETARAGVGAAAMVLTAGLLAKAAERWPFVRRPIDLVVVAAIAVIPVGLIVELICGVSSAGTGTGRVPLHSQIALAIAYAPNAGFAVLVLGLGCGLGVTGISPSYFAFVSRFAGDGPTAAFGDPHGERVWAQALHLPGLVSVFAVAPVAIVLLACSARWLRSRGELITWAIGESALLLGLGAAAAAQVGVNYEGFVLAGTVAPTWWGRMVGLVVVPLGLAVFVLTRSAAQPSLDVSDGTRELGRKVP